MACFMRFLNRQTKHFRKCEEYPTCPDYHKDLAECQLGGLYCMRKEEIDEKMREMQKTDETKIQKTLRSLRTTAKRR